MAAALSLAVSLVGVSSVLAFPSGAPKELCGSPLGRPVHNNTLPQSTCSPYRIYLNSTIYSPNVPINVTIWGNDIPFRGFLITADTTTGLFDGTCLNTDTKAKAVPNCGMTHSRNDNKTVVTLLWYPPLLVHVGYVQFKLVVVQNFSTYWTDIRSAAIVPDTAEYYSPREIMDMRRKHQRSNNAGHLRAHNPPVDVTARKPLL